MVLAQAVLGIQRVRVDLKVEKHTMFYSEDFIAFYSEDFIKFYF